jgi:hypothetical protein
LNLGREVEDAWEARRDSPRLKWTRGIVGVLLAWGYTTDGLGNLDFDVIGTVDSLTGDVMFIVVVVVVVVVIVIVAFAFVLLSAWWIGSGRV